MSRLDELIAELCPDGVALRELGSFSRGEKAKNTDKHCTLAYSITKGGLVRTEDYFKEAKVTSDDTSGYRIVKRNWFVYSPSRIDVGSINYLQDQDEVIVSPLNVVFSVDESTVLPKYLLYFLQSRRGTWQILTSREGIAGTGRKLLPFEKMAKVLVPVPPIEIQFEIVRVLDQFNEYRNVLSEELSARRKQYEYYRSRLLAFNSDVKVVSLESIADIGTGSSNTNEGLEEGAYPFFVRSQEPLRKNDYEFDETAIITAGDGVGVGKVFHYVEGKYALHQRAYRIHIKSSNVLPRYYFHYMKFAFLPYIQKTMFQGSVPSIRRPMLNAFPVPVPPIPVQERLVNVLDNFEAICSDLNIGLPAEIEARQKQYEYYRDLLLTFAETGDTLATDRQTDRQTDRLK